MSTWISLSELIQLLQAPFQSSVHSKQVLYSQRERVLLGNGEVKNASWFRPHKYKTVYFCEEYIRVYKKSLIIFCNHLFSSFC